MSSKITEEVKARVRVSARHRCGYCLAQQRYTLLVLEMEHIIASARGGTDAEENLWLASACNVNSLSQQLACEHVHIAPGQRASATAIWFTCVGYICVTQLVRSLLTN
jgi:HNH endonuclease